LGQTGQSLCEEQIMTERVWRLRAMSVADLLDETIRLYRHNFLTFVGIVAILQIPLAIVSIVVSLLGIPFITLIEGILELVLINALTTAALALAISNCYLDKPISIGSAYRSVLGRFWPLIGALFLLGLVNAALLGIPLVLLTLVQCLGVVTLLGVLVPVVLINVRLAFIAQAIVLEPCSASESLRRSWDLVKGYGWRTVGVMLLLGIFSLLLVSGPAYLVTLGLLALKVSPVARTVISGVLSVVLTVLYMPIRLSGMTLLYYDLRIRKEGLDLELQAAALGEGSGEPLLDLTPRDFLAAGSTQASKSEEEIQAQIDEAGRLHDAGDLQGAIRAYWAAIARRPHDALLQNDLGLALHQAGYLDAALLRFQTAADLEPDDPTAFYNLALLQRDRGRLDAAREALRTYLELEPDAAVRASVQNDPTLADLLGD
jgi:hypothetical protein